MKSSASVLQECIRPLLLVSIFLCILGAESKADRVFNCMFSGGNRRIVLASKSPDRFPVDYKFVKVQDLSEEGVVLREYGPYKLELLHGTLKDAVFRFLIGRTSGTSGGGADRFGVIAWAPGATPIYVNLTSHGVANGPRAWGDVGRDNCRPAE